MSSGMDSVRNWNEGCAMVDLNHAYEQSTNILAIFMPEKLPTKITEKAARIKLLVLDVDGTLTDGGLYLGPDGQEFKRFDVHDGHGIVMLQKLHDVEVMILSGRTSAAVSARAIELGIGTCLQGHWDKRSALARELEARQVPEDQVGVMGDDLSDLAMMLITGVAFAPANAVAEVKQRADYTTRATGGYGAVREVCDLIIAAKAALLG